MSEEKLIRLIEDRIDELGDHRELFDQHHLRRLAKEGEVNDFDVAQYELSRLLKMYERKVKPEAPEDGTRKLYDKEEDDSND